MPRTIPTPRSQTLSLTAKGLRVGDVMLICGEPLLVAAVRETRHGVRVELSDGCRLELTKQTVLDVSRAVPDAARGGR